MSRFVVLHHQFPAAHPRETHWDLMLEFEGRLLTWALDEPPLQDQLTTRLPDHRLFYLDYEGPVSGDRGSVVQWDAGAINWLNDAQELSRFAANPSDTPGAASDAPRIQTSEFECVLSAILDGDKLAGRLELRFVRNAARRGHADANQRWWLCVSEEPATREV